MFHTYRAEQQACLCGLSIANTHNAIETHQQLGGQGIVYNKSLAIPAHQGYPWSSIEFVSIPPGGHNSVGRHIQTTDEIYLIVSGQGEMITNGEKRLVLRGTLALAPMGTIHEIANRSATEWLSFLVVELQPSVTRETHYSPACFNLLEDLQPVHHHYPMCRGKQTVFPSGTTLDLSSHFSSPWGSISLLNIPPGATTETYAELARDQLLFSLQGLLRVEIWSGFREPLRVISDGESHLSVLIPQGILRRFANQASGDYPLLLASLTVFRQTPSDTVVPLRRRTHAALHK